MPVDVGGFPVIYVVCGAALLFIIWALQSAAPSAAADPVLQVGGAKLSVMETVVGTAMGVVFVLCVVPFGRLQAEVDDRYIAETVGASQFGLTSTSSGQQDQVVNWLLQTERLADDDDFLYRQTYRAVSVTDSHSITRRTLGTLDVIIRSALWFVVIMTAAQTIIVSRRLNGLRIIMPLMVVGLLVVFVAAVPSNDEFARILWRLPAAPH